MRLGVEPLGEAADEGSGVFDAENARTEGEQAEAELGGERGFFGGEATFGSDGEEEGLIRGQGCESNLMEVGDWMGIDGVGVS